MENEKGKLMENKIEITGRIQFCILKLRYSGKVLAVSYNPDYSNIYKDPTTEIVYMSFPISLTLDGYLHIEFPKLNINIYSKTVGGLQKDLYTEIKFLWKEYALEKDRKLSLEARELKQRLLSVFQEQDIYFKFGG